MAFSNYADVKAGYANLWERCTIKPDKRNQVSAIFNKISQNRRRYESVSPNIPWFFVGIVHHLESGGNFSTHLHNGDPLTRRTTHVPAGRPVNGSPPFKWEDSARDAMEMKGLTRETDWSPPKACWNFERFNGFGYVSKGINSPYVWSFSNLYSAGKYVRDGVFDRSAVSQQCGAGTILKFLIEATTPTPELDIDQPLLPVQIHQPASLPVIYVPPKPKPPEPFWIWLWATLRNAK